MARYIKRAAKFEPRQVRAGTRPGNSVTVIEKIVGRAGAMSANYDVTSDGQRFLMVKDLDQDAVSTRIVVVLNFAEELKRLTAATKS